MLLFVPAPSQLIPKVAVATPRAGPQLTGNFLVACHVMDASILNLSLASAKFKDVKYACL